MRKPAEDSAGLAQRPGDSEVGHQRVAAREHDVFRLQVAVDNSVQVRGGKRVSDVPQDPDRVSDRQLTLACDPFTKRRAGDERHDVVQEAGGIP